MVERRTENANQVDSILHGKRPFLPHRTRLRVEWDPCLYLKMFRLITDAGPYRSIGRCPALRLAAMPQRHSWQTVRHRPPAFQTRRCMSCLPSPPRRGCSRRTFRRIPRATLEAEGQESTDLVLGPVLLPERLYGLRSVRRALYNIPVGVVERSAGMERWFEASTSCTSWRTKDSNLVERRHEPIDHRGRTPCPDEARVWRPAGRG
jgi:hypothetical protein